MNIQNVDNPISHTSFGIASIYLRLRDQQPPPWLMKLEHDQLERKYNISSFKKQLPICVGIPSFNNIKNNRYLVNIKSILRQNYTNYRVVYLDDASTDGTADAVQEYLTTHNIPSTKFKIYRNPTNLKIAQNSRNLAKLYCQAYQLFVLIDGDDSLAGVNVFKLYNAIFQSGEYYMVYMNQITLKNYKIGQSQTIDQKMLVDRKYRVSGLWYTYHLSAYYTKLFHLIDDNHLKYNGHYFTSAADRSIIYSVIEMSGTKIKYIPQIIYLYNDLSQYNNQLIRIQQQHRNAQIIFQYPPYQTINSLFDQESIGTCCNLKTSQIAMKLQQQK